MDNNDLVTVTMLSESDARSELADACAVACWRVAAGTGDAQDALDILAMMPRKVVPAVTVEDDTDLVNFKL